jgi:hypothetical protein
MNLDETSEDFRRKLDLAPPDAQIRVILKLALPQSVPTNPIDAKTRQDRRKQRSALNDLLTAAFLPIKEQLDAIGLREATVLSALGCATVSGTPQQIKRALALEGVIGATHDTNTVLIQGHAGRPSDLAARMAKLLEDAAKDHHGHADRVTEERKDKGPPQVGG